MRIPPAPFLLACFIPSFACSSAPAADGCKIDDDCKGDRVCEEGACVAPDGPSAGGATADGGAIPGGGDAGGGNETGPGGGTTEPGAPQFLSFGTNVTKLDGGDPPLVTFTAVLTDPDGVDDLIGGSLLDESGAPYGAFVTSGQEGAYQMTVTWEDINTITAIDFAPGADGMRSFTAEFFDGAGHKATRNISLTLSCSGLAACDGRCREGRCGTQCVYFGDNDNCGACDNDCGNGFCDSEQQVCTGLEDTDAFCSDGFDNDEDGYFDCTDFNCSMNPDVTVCP